MHGRVRDMHGRIRDMDGRVDILRASLVLYAPHRLRQHHHITQTRPFTPSLH